MAVIEGNKTNFKEEVLKSEKRVLVDFNAVWCGPCKMLKPTLEAIAEENDAVKIVAVDVDEAEDLAMQYNVSSIPCLVLFENGAEVKRNVGLITRDEIEELIGGEA